MNKKVGLLAGLCLLVMAVAVSAQDKIVDFSGDWKLDVEKSELGGRSRIESMTMKVTQSETELSVERKAKRVSDGSIGGALGGGNRGRGRQRMRAGAFPITKYDLSGKETTVEMSDGIMTGETKFKSRYENGKLILTQNRSLNTPRGERKVKTVETWELSADGKALTISSERQARRGTINSKMVFNKANQIVRGSVDTKIKDERNLSTPTFKGDRDTSVNQPPPPPVPSRISGGVINGKATSLPSPAYPKSALAAGAKGSVNVAVVISKDGYVMSAAAVSGHPLLRKASVDAAKQAKFKPTILSGQKVEVSGVLVYNFQ